MPDLIIPLIGLIDGAALLLIAIFAPQLGIDPNSGWGKGRLALLIVGVIVFLVTALVIFPGRNKIPFLEKTLKSKGLKSILILGHIWIFVFIIYIWFITYGNWTTWLHTSSYYDKLANSFSRGHLYIDIKPDPALLAVPDPYAAGSRPPIQNDIWDMSLYEGKFYLYWGPAPSLLITPLKFFYSGKITDNYLVFFFYSGLLIFNSLLILKVWNKSFPNMPGWAVFLCILLIGLIGPIPWSISEPNIYDAAVGAGQFFLMGGVYWLISAFDKNPDISNTKLFLAGLFWALAVGSRALYAITVTSIAGITVVWMIKNHFGSISHLRLLIHLSALAAPLTAGAIALGWYNWARFGSPLEFGLRYQISIWNLNKLYGFLFLPKYIFPNLIVYLFQPVQSLSVFPFVQPIVASELFQRINYVAPQIYYAGKVSGLLFSAPFLIIALINIAPIENALLGHTVAENPLFYKFTFYILLSAFLVGFILLLIFFVGSMRYLVDVISPLTLVATFGYWRVVGEAGIDRSNFRKIFLILATLLIALSISLGLLLAFSAETNRFQNLNPDLFNQIVHLFPPFK